MKRVRGGGARRREREREGREGEEREREKGLGGFPANFEISRQEKKCIRSDYH